MAKRTASASLPAAHGLQPHRVSVEGFFATLSKRRLKRGVFGSEVDLRAAINRFLDDHNANSKPTHPMGR
jgi:hypothetical protein